MLDAIGAGLAPRIGDRDWKDIWLDSPEYKQMREELEHIKADGLSRPASEKHSESTCECYRRQFACHADQYHTRRYAVLGTAQGGRAAQ